MVKNLDVHCPRSHCLSHNIFSKMQTQGSKDSFCSEKPKNKNLKSVLVYDNMAELVKKEDKKKSSWGIGRNVLESGKNKPWQMLSIPRPLKKKK